MLLAIDTATQLLSIALHDGDTLLAECTLTAERNHSALLAPLIERTLAQCGFARDDLTALAVCVGPGSYTGLRIGIALAKGMAAVRNLPVAPVSSLDIIAAAQDRATGAETLIVTVPAGRQRVIWADYRHDENGWVAQGETRLGSWDELFQAQTGRYALSGEITAAGLARDSSGHRIRSADPLDRGGEALAARRLSGGNRLATIARAWSRCLSGRSRQADLPQVTGIGRTEHA